ncbi:MAG: cytochrome c biogenesis protein CcsA [Bacteroidaceae bacterium]|nr:cytochrome c biogenesis protein CcsA [Bacteroidaceae bacterium]
MNDKKFKTILYAILGVATFITILVGLISRSGVQSWTFRIIYALMCLVLLVDAIRRLRPFSLRRLPLAVMQLGLVIALAGGAIGSQMREEEELKVFEGSTESFRNLSVTLNDFIMDVYPNGRPKRFASDLVVRTADGKESSGIIEVNHPLSVGGWKIYQYDYDSEAGVDSAYSVLGMVREPLQGVMFAGILLMLAAAVLLLMTSPGIDNKTKPRRNGWQWIIWGCAMVALIFFLFTVLSPQIVSKMPVPALQSPWFAPHVLVYILAYAMAAVSAILSIRLLVASKERREAIGLSACDAFARAAFAFITVGMLFGALWAERAWGGYWSWDPKETWAGITWLAYLLCLHVREKSPEAQRAALWLYIFAFLCLLMCWQGINLLPSARADSIHLY